MLRIAVLIAVLAVAGCSRVSLVYNRLDWLVPWYLDDYISLDDSQQRLLSVRLEDQLNWHRTTQLPRYADWLQRLEQATADGLSAAELERLEADMRAAWDDLASRLAPDAAAILSTSSEQQIAELFAAIAAENQEYRAEWLEVSAEQRQRERAQRMTKGLERWFGDLTPRQARLVTRWAADSGVDAKATLAYRQRWQARLREILAQRASRQRLNAALTDLLVRPEQVQSPEFQRQREQTRQRFKTLLIELTQSMNGAQRRHLAAEIDALASDFSRLAANTD